MTDERREPKIIVDSDWKSQAQAEKERLAAAEREKAQKAPAKAGSPAGAGGAPGGDAEDLEALPEPNFKGLLGTLITNALMYLGAFPDPQTGRAMVAPEYAKFHIDLMEVLKEKTKGNLTPEEQEQMDQSLNELKMQFVEIMRAVTAMAMKEQAKTAGAGAMGAGGGPSLDPTQVAQRLRGQ